MVNEWDEHIACSSRARSLVESVIEGEARKRGVPLPCPSDSRNSLHSETRCADSITPVDVSPMQTQALRLQWLEVEFEVSVVEKVELEVRVIEFDKMAER